MSFKTFILNFFGIKVYLTFLNYSTFRSIVHHLEAKMFLFTLTITNKVGRFQIAYFCGVLG